MAIITISARCFSHDSQIAGKVARCLNCGCLSREILRDTSCMFHISETKPIRSLQQAPTIFEKTTHGNKKYPVYIQTALLERVKRSNVVYYGLAGSAFRLAASNRLVKGVHFRFAIKRQRKEGQPQFA
ncbi:MAG: hypothetical protein JRJ12_10390 [Deltaproteobacteria bacterium]|nr:hypothetical protein [Deltaproteobacteria bacterium]MBW2070691.1 hypothetical protein [Deltaproteobacteria bacterium]